MSFDPFLQKEAKSVKHFKSRGTVFLVVFRSKRSRGKDNDLYWNLDHMFVSKPTVFVRSLSGNQREPFISTYPFSPSQNYWTDLIRGKPLARKWWDGSGLQL